MRRPFMWRLGGVAVLSVAQAALLACGAPAPRTRCTADAECAGGEYCDPAGVCWPHAGAPVIDSVTVTCLAPCLRDSVVTVSAVAHDDIQLAAVTASLDLAPATAVPLTLQGGTWQGSLPLGDWPFPAFERPVELTVEARDVAGNRATASRPVGTVTQAEVVGGVRAGGAAGAGARRRGGR